MKVGEPFGTGKSRSLGDLANLSQRNAICAIIKAIAPHLTPEGKQYARAHPEGFAVIVDHILRHRLRGEALEGAIDALILATNESGRKRFGGGRVRFRPRRRGNGKL